MSSNRSTFFCFFRGGRRRSSRSTFFCFFRGGRRRKQFSRKIGRQINQRGSKLRKEGTGGGIKRDKSITGLEAVFLRGRGGANHGGVVVRRGGGLLARSFLLQTVRNSKGEEVGGELHKISDWRGEVSKLYLV